jgi:hypothetical protein
MYVCTKPLVVKMPEFAKHTVTVDEVLAHDTETIVKLVNRHVYGYGSLLLVAEHVLEKGHGMRPDLHLSPHLFQYRHVAQCTSLVSCVGSHRSVLFGLRNYDLRPVHKLQDGEAEGEVPPRNVSSLIQGSHASSKLSQPSSQVILTRWKHPNAAINCAMRASAHGELREARSQASLKVPYTGKNNPSVIKTGFKW